MITIQINRIGRLFIYLCVEVEAISPGKELPLQLCMKASGGHSCSTLITDTVWGGRGLLPKFLQDDPTMAIVNILVSNITLMNVYVGHVQ